MASPERIEMLRELSRERALLFRAQRAKIELQNARLRAELVPKAIIAEVWARIATNVRTRILNVANLAGPLGAIHDTAARHRRLTDALADALEELSTERNAELVRLECEKLFANRGELDATEIEAAAAVDGEPMGRSEPAVKPRARRRARQVDNGAD